MKVLLRFIITLRIYMYVTLYDKTLQNLYNGENNLDFSAYIVDLHIHHLCCSEEQKI